MPVAPDGARACPGAMVWPQVFSDFQTSQISEIFKFFEIHRMTSPPPMPASPWGLENKAIFFWGNTSAHFFCVEEGPEVLCGCRQLARHLPLPGKCLFCLRPGALAKKGVKRDNGAPNRPPPPH